MRILQLTLGTGKYKYINNEHYGKYGIRIYNLGNMDAKNKFFISFSGQSNLYGAEISGGYRLALNEFFVSLQAGTKIGFVSNTIVGTQDADSNWFHLPDFPLIKSLANSCGLNIIGYQFAF